MGTTVNSAKQNTGAGNRSLQNKLQLVDYLKQIIHSLQYAATLDQASSGRAKSCEHFDAAVAALKTKLAQELAGLKDQ